MKNKFGKHCDMFNKDCDPLSCLADAKTVKGFLENPEDPLESSDVHSVACAAIVCSKRVLQSIDWGIVIRN